MNQLKFHNANPRLFPCLAFIVSATLLISTAPAQTTAAYRFIQVAPGIYSAIGTGVVNVGSNSAIIIGEKDVMIVDSTTSPAAARALLNDLKSITDKPVRYVVNTHYHFDHAFGNQIFSDDVQVIGHEFTREKLLIDGLHDRTYATFLTALPGRIEDLKKRAAGETDLARKPILLEQIKVQEAFLIALAEVKPTPPTVTFQTKMNLHMAGREIQLIFLGRGHTGGDIIVYLPKERIICTGDFFTEYIGYMGDAFVDAWADSLDELKKLDFDTIIPGHGEPFKDKQKIALVQACLRDLWKQASELKQQGVAAGDAAKRIDLRSHNSHFPQFRDQGVTPVAVVRIYELIDQRTKKKS